MVSPERETGMGGGLPFCRAIINDRPTYQHFRPLLLVFDPTRSHGGPPLSCLSFIRKIGVTLRVPLTDPTLVVTIATAGCTTTDHPPGHARLAVLRPPHNLAWMLQQPYQSSAR